MDILQKFSTPIAIVIAGALIGGAVLYSNKSASAPSAQGPSWVKQTIRGITETDHVLGSKNAKVVLMEYSDTECPFCARFHATLHQIKTEYGDKVTWVYRHFPLTQLHPKAPKEAEALECAKVLGGDDMFWKYTDLLYGKTKSNNSLDIGVYNTPSPTPTGEDGKPYYAEAKPRSATDAGKLSDFAFELGLNRASFESCLKSGKMADRVNADAKEIIALGGSGTPTSYLLVKGKQYLVEGAVPYAQLKKMIDEALQK